MEVPQMSAHFTDVWPLPGLDYLIYLHSITWNWTPYTGTPYNVQYAKDLDNTHWTEEPLQQELDFSASVLPGYVPNPNFGW